MHIVIGIASTLCLLINMTFWSSLLFIVGIARIIIPIESWRKICTSYTVFIGETCIALNYLWIKLLHRPDFEIQGLKNVNKSTWYIATANHQSWADILILQAVTNRKIPLIRFFMKDVLKWIPIVWIVGWALDMPFLSRYSEKKIKENPSLRGGDIKNMKKAFRRLSTNPGTIFSFAEGTRFTEKKHADQNSPYNKLLLPKAGGIGITLSTMPYISYLLDFTITYNSDSRDFWDFLCGRMSEVKIKVRKIDIPDSLLKKDYSSQPEFRQELKNWLNDIWEEKNKFLNLN